MGGRRSENSMGGLGGHLICFALHQGVVALLFGIGQAGDRRGKACMDSLD